MLRSFVPAVAVMFFAGTAHAQYAPTPQPTYYGPGPGPYAGPYAPAPPPPKAGCGDVAEDDPWEYDDDGCKKSKDKPWEPGGVFGVRVGMTTTAGADNNGTYGAVMVGGHSEQFRTRGVFTLHASSHGTIGGGSAGFEGGLGGFVAGGVRAPIGQHHGPFARIGLHLEMLGNSQFYFSQISLPVAEVGYQYIKGRTVLELGGRGAPVITGRYNTGHRTRRELGSGSLQWGGYAAVHAKFGRLDVSYVRFEADDNFPGGPVGVLRGNGCGYIKRIGICLDGMYIRGDGYFGLPAGATGLGLTRSERDTRSFYGGLTIGVIDL